MQCRKQNGLDLDRLWLNEPSRPRLLATRRPDTTCSFGAISCVVGEGSSSFDGDGGSSQCIRHRDAPVFSFDPGLLEQSHCFALRIGLKESDCAVIHHLQTCQIPDCCGSISAASGFRDHTCLDASRGSLQPRWGTCLSIRLSHKPNSYREFGKVS